MISYIYAMPIWIIVVAIILLPFIRGFVNIIPKWLNNIFFTCCVLAIIYSTLFRTSYNEQVVFWQPFISFEFAKEQPEVYRELIMNVLLFLPMGLFLPYSVKKKNILITALSALLLSVCIEVLQYVFVIGVAEIDDVIFNVLGATIGSLSYLIFRKKYNAKYFIGLCK